MPCIGAIQSKVPVFISPICIGVIRLWWVREVFRCVVLAVHPHMVHQ